MLRLTLFGVLALGSAYGASCDRACLKTTLDQYLTAVVQHKPASAPLSVGFRQTENAMVRRLGTGLWESAKGLGKLQLRFFDPESGQAGYFGTLEEATGPAIVTLRMKVEDRKISEAEWVLARKGDPGLGPLGGGQATAAYNDVPNLLAHAPGERVAPKAGRVSRSELIAITNSYWDGLSAHDGKLILAHPGCTRLENGTLTTQRSLPAGGETDCTSEGAMANIFAVTARRYPIVDEEAGVVLSLVLFERKPGIAMRRNLLAEWFFIEQGKIRSIYASMYYPDAEAMAPNWPPYDGNWPILPAPK
ncbi:MAG: hypothetical protein LAP61_10715 [Acidobacteriia bacterium]|nr:hypothetical protein [Terriglobia bacterium]